MILDNNSMERITIDIQAKTLPIDYKITYQYKYSCDTKVFNVVLNNVTFNPVVLLLVDKNDKKIFWKYISKEYAESLTIGTQKNKIIIVLAVTVIFLSVLTASPIVNDNMAKKTANELVDLPLPNNTEFIESVYKAGKLVGNGNGMQYFGAILIKSELSLEELKEYYSEFNTIFHEFDIRGH